MFVVMYAKLCPSIFCVHKAQGHTTMIIMYIQNNNVDLEQCIFVHFVALGQVLLVQTIFSDFSVACI